MKGEPKEEPYISELNPIEEDFVKRKSVWGISVFAKDKMDALDTYLRAAGSGKATPEDFKGIYSLDKIIDNEALFSKYPELKRYNVVFADFHTKQKRGIHVDNTIYINSKLYEKDPGLLESTIVHEIQHAKQKITGKFKDINEFASQKEKWESEKEVDARRKQEEYIQHLKTVKNLAEEWSKKFTQPASAPQPAPQQQSEKNDSVSETESKPQTETKMQSLKTVADIQQKILDETGIKTTVRRGTGSMKGYLHIMPLFQKGERPYLPFEFAMKMKNELAHFHTEEHPVFSSKNEISVYSIDDDRVQMPKEKKPREINENTPSKQWGSKNSQLRLDKAVARNAKKIRSGNVASYY